MENEQTPGNAGQQENQEHMGFPDKETNTDAGPEIEDAASLPSDGPFSQSEVSEADELTEGLENDDPKNIRKDAETGS